MTSVAERKLSQSHFTPSSPDTESPRTCDTAMLTCRDQFLLPTPQEDAVKVRLLQQEKGLGAWSSSYKHCACEKCISVSSYCLPGTAVGWVIAHFSLALMLCKKAGQDRVSCSTHPLRCSASELPRVRANMSKSSSSLPEVSRDCSPALTLLEPRSVGERAG